MSRKMTFCCPDYGHTWDDSVRYFLRKRGQCPYCTMKRTLTGFNDLATTHPQIAAQAVNEDDATTYRSNSHTSIPWRCERGHEWSAPVVRRCVHDSGCPYCTNRELLPGFNDLASRVPGVVAAWHESNRVGPAQVVYGSETMIYLRCFKDESHVVEIRPYIVSRRPGATSFVCRRCSTSSGAMEVREFIEELIGDRYEVRSADRSVLSGKELDILVPEKGIAVEFNGLYWHSDAHSKPYDHYEKWEGCARAGIQLITVWEDDWQNRRGVVCSMLASKLGVFDAPRIGARTTAPASIGEVECEAFMEANHIQGFSKGSHFALRYGDSPVAVMTVRKSGRSLEIIRYATSANVPGGFTKLLRYVQDRYAGQVDEIVTFAAHDVSDGGLYARSGFRVDKMIDPDYSYVVRGCRVHKFNLRKESFRRDPRLLFSPELTERELAELNGLGRVYDAGKTRYVKTL